MRRYLLRGGLAFFAFSLAYLSAERLLGQPGGGEEPPPPPANWEIVVPPPFATYTQVSSVPGNGPAAQKSYAYLYYVYFEGGQKSVGGLSSPNYNWSTSVDPPAATGNKWPVGFGSTLLVVDAEAQDWTSLIFY